MTCTTVHAGEMVILTSGEDAGGAIASGECGSRGGNGYVDHSKIWQVSWIGS